METECRGGGRRSMLWRKGAMCGPLPNLLKPMLVLLGEKIHMAAR